MRIYFQIIILLLNLSIGEISAQNELGELLDNLNKVDFNLNDFKSTIKNKNCTKHFSKDIPKNQIACKLSKSFTKNLSAKRITITTEPIMVKKEMESISFIISKFHRKDSKALENLKDDYEKLTSTLNKKFKFDEKEFHKGGESAERLTNWFISESNTTIRIERLIGGCFRKKQIIISIFKEK